MQLIKEKLYIMNKIESERFEFTKDKSYAIISVFTPDTSKASFIIPEDQKENINILYSGFYDVLESETVYDLEKRDYVTLDPLSEDESLAIALFIKLNYDVVDYFIVHCEMGIGRSAGIVKAILKWKYSKNKVFSGNVVYNEEIYDEEFYKNKMYQYNDHVYEKIYNSLSKQENPETITEVYVKNRNRYRN
jgi:hypothetical protein